MARMPRRSAACLLSLAGVLAAAGTLRAQDPAQQPEPLPTPPTVGGPGAGIPEELLKELNKLKDQVKELEQLKVKAKEAEQLQGEVKELKKQLKKVQEKTETLEKGPPPPLPPAMPPPPTPDEDPEFYSLIKDPSRRIPSAVGQGPGGGFAGPRAARFYANTGPTGGGKINDHFPLGAAYKWNFNGGYTSLATPDGEFVLNIQQLVAVDTVNRDRQAVLSPFSGFDTPNYRLYTYGNITKYLEYQTSFQQFAGSFNMIDMYGNIHYDDRLMLRMGRFLSPFLFDYYGQSPLFLPTMINSPLFQMAGKRNFGVEFWGKLWDYKIQYRMGIFNGPNGTYFDLDRNKDFMATWGITPFKGDGIEWLDSLGATIGLQTGKQNYNLYALDNPYLQNTEFPNGTGEPQLNRSWITSDGVVFSQYNKDVWAVGNRTKIAPGFFWLGRFSVSGEYLIQSRDLMDSNTRGTSVQRGYYVRASYFLTGERFNGDSTGLYTMISPINPFNPVRGHWGWGAWMPAFEYSELDVGTGDQARGFISPIWATRLNQLEAGIHWYPNKYTRFSFMWQYARFNKAVPLSPGASPVDNYNNFWGRFSIFF